MEPPEPLVWVEVERWLGVRGYNRHIHSQPGHNLNEWESPQLRGQENLHLEEVDRSVGLWKEEDP